MDIKEFLLLNHAYNASAGRARIKSDLQLNAVLKDRRVYRSLVEKGWLDNASGEITEANLKNASELKIQSSRKQA